MNSWDLGAGLGTLRLIHLSWAWLALGEDLCKGSEILVSEAVRLKLQDPKQGKKALPAGVGAPFPCLGPPAGALLPFLFWGSSPKNRRFRKKGTLILTSLLEDLDVWNLQTLQISRPPPVNGSTFGEIQ